MSIFGMLMCYLFTLCMEANLSVYSKQYPIHLCQRRFECCIDLDCFFVYLFVCLFSYCLILFCSLFVWFSCWSLNLNKLIFSLLTCTCKWKRQYLLFLWMQKSFTMWGCMGTCTKRLCLLNAMVVLFDNIREYCTSKDILSLKSSYVYILYSNQSKVKASA